MGYRTEGWQSIKVGSKVKILKGTGNIEDNIGKVLVVNEIQEMSEERISAYTEDLFGEWVGSLFVGEDCDDQVELISEDAVEAPKEALQEESDSPIAEYTKPVNLPLSAAQLVLSQTNNYNGHMQLELSEMKLSDARQLVIDLINTATDKCFVLQLQAPCEWMGTHWSASVYELDGISSGVDKLWLGIDKIVEE